MRRAPISPRYERNPVRRVAMALRANAVSKRAQADTQRAQADVQRAEADAMERWASLLENYSEVNHEHKSKRKRRPAGHLRSRTHGRATTQKKAQQRQKK